MDDNTDMLLFARAAEFAAQRHSKQRRKDGDIPYINHPLGVARILAEEGGVLDGDVLAAALLHDTVEDTETTVEELRVEFGDVIAGTVAEVTDDKAQPKHVRKQQQVIHSVQMTTAAKLVKMADKIYNLRDLVSAPPSSWDLSRIQGYFCWAFHVVEGVLSTNKGLGKSLDDLFSGSFEFGGECHLVLPEADDARRDLLASYYKQMQAARD